MCGRYSLTSPLDALQAPFSFDELPNLRPRYNIAPTQEVPVVRTRQDGGREFVAMRWGLVPSWARQIGGGPPLINARAETLAEKPSFRNAFARRRCLVAADSFYEWKTAGTGPKQPYRIALPGDAPFAFAGIWERWDGGAGGALESFAIVTTEAAPAIADIHHRMPVILPPESYGGWLAGPDAGLLAPYAGELHAYPIGTAVNKVANDDASLWQVDEPRNEAEQLDLL